MGTRFFSMSFSSTVCFLVFFTNVTVSAGLFINEFMPLNETTLQDEFEEFDDWLELFYDGDTVINLRGFGISDRRGTPHRYVIDGDLFISPGGFALIWCDGDSGQGIAHTNFRLSASGEWIGISAPLSSGGAIIDSMSFPAMEADFSFGRFCDSCDSIGILPYPTPLSSNNYTEISEKISRPEKLSLDISPNPFNSSVRISWVDKGLINQTPTIEIFDIMGKRVVDTFFPYDNEKENTFEFFWSPEKSLPSGIYVVRASNGDESISKNMIYLK